MVAERKKHTLAAVAGIQAAETYGLSVLMRGIQTNQSNYTRFVIIGKKKEISPKADKMTLVVTLPHEPGSLYRVLSHFDEESINMTNIESRPIPGRPWEYFSTWIFPVMKRMKRFSGPFEAFRGNEPIIPS